MSKALEDRIKKLSYLNFQKISDSRYFLAKTTTKNLEKGHCYIIELDNSLLDVKSNLLAINWNDGKVPLYNIYKVEVNKTLPNMAYVTGVAFNLDTKTDLLSFWSGWLQVDKVKILEEL